MACRLQDLSGYGVSVAVGKEFAGAFPDRTFKSPLVDLLIKSGRNGNTWSLPLPFKQKQKKICFFFVLKALLVQVTNAFCLWLTYIVSGKNNGKGYYIYEKGSKPKPDPSVLPIIEESRRICNLTPNGKVLLFRSITYNSYLDRLVSFCAYLVA